MKRAILLLLLLPSLLWAGVVLIQKPAVGDASYSETFTDCANWQANYLEGDGTISCTDVPGVFRVLGSTVGTAWNRDEIHYTANDTNTVAQYAALQIVAAAEGFGVMVRSPHPVSTSGKRYALYQYGSTGAACNIRWEVVTGYDTETEIARCVHGTWTVQANDSLGIEITGTGASTQAKFYFWRSQVPPSYPWSSGLACTCTNADPTVTCTYETGWTPTIGSRIAVTSDLDTNTGVGMVYMSGYSGHPQIDNWKAGDQ